MKTTNPFLLLLSLLLFFGNCTQPTEKAEEPAPKEYRIIAYLYGSQVFDPAVIDATKFTHVNYAFADVQDGKVVNYLPYDSINYEVLNGLKKDNPELKILISLGGWGRSKGFSDAALTPESREIFAQSAVDYVKRYKIDGVDIDWEYPGQIGDNNPFRTEDKENFTEMLKSVREKLDALSKAENRFEDNPYLLTIATGANQKYLDHTEMDKAHHYLDFINIMTYDFSGGYSDTTAHHANLFPSDIGSGSKRDVNKAVKEHVNAGIPIEKLVMGFPFYGRSWTEVNAGNNGLHQFAGPGPRGSHLYHTLAQEMENKNGFTRYWDEAAKVPYLWNESSQTFITYDDTTSFRIKCKYIKEEGMGGAMFWQYFGDTTGMLLNVLHEELK
ncbi:MAG: glycoside hydrolase family 18 protein [Bacteroidetes bacterium]|nr:glycoside hydrolase family 18 protein [Bacteroidota bacterium]